MPEKLTLNNGTELENSNAILSGDLFLYVRGKTIRGAFDLLVKPANTSVIVYTLNNGDDITYEGYTKLKAITDEGNGLITAVLRREVA